MKKLQVYGGISSVLLSVLFSLSSYATLDTSTVGEEKSYPVVTNLDVDFPSDKEFFSHKPVPAIYTKETRAIILRHLATSSRWLLIDEHGRSGSWQYALMSGDPKDKPLNKLYGQYSQVLIDSLKSSLVKQGNCPDLNAPGMATILDEGALFPSLKHFDVYLEDKSHCKGMSLSESHDSNSRCFDIGEAVIFVNAEEPVPSKVKDELLLAIGQRVYDELKSVSKSPVARKTGFDLTLMPISSVKSGKPELKLWNGMQPGIYNIAAYVNPGEEGFAYLKGFELKSNTPLTIGHNLEDTKEYIGWSNQPGKNFLYHRQCTVYTGGWSSKYPARIELWFQAKNRSKPERKLVEATYMINGWER